MTTININLQINDGLYLKDPQMTPLGQKILKHSVLLIDELGFENFTFGKLAKLISSTEASIYRYFENKHKLFVYLLNWYWEWMKFRIDFNTMNISDPRRCLQIAISVIVDTAKRNTSVGFIDEDVLHRIVVAEGIKAYHHKGVDDENKEGFFLAYKSLCQKISVIIQQLNADFPYPRALASTLIESANNHVYFARHLPRLTDIDYSDENYFDQIIHILESLAFGTLDAFRKPSEENATEQTFQLKVEHNQLKKGSDGYS
jgi:AcrR family transcriptional regulator